jgi:hypothetical protein
VFFFTAFRFFYEKNTTVTHYQKFNKHGTFTIQLAKVFKASLLFSAYTSPYPVSQIKALDVMKNFVNYRQWVLSKIPLV